MSEVEFESMKTKSYYTNHIVHTDSRPRVFDFLLQHQVSRHNLL